MKKFCIWCGAYLVDTDTGITANGEEVSYYKAIALKYCDDCREKAYKQGDSLRMYNFRQSLTSLLIHTIPTGIKYLFIIVTRTARKNQR